MELRVCHASPKKHASPKAPPKQPSDTSTAATPTPAAVADKQQIAVETLHDLINDHTWPDFATVARLEIHFNRRLWGHEHKPRRRKPPTT